VDGAAGHEAQVTTIVTELVGELYPLAEPDRGYHGQPIEARSRPVIDCEGTGGDPTGGACFTEASKPPSNIRRWSIGSSLAAPSVSSHAATGSGKRGSKAGTAEYGAGLGLAPVRQIIHRRGRDARVP
jgi:hypothetical protein